MPSNYNGKRGRIEGVEHTEKCNFGLANPN